MLRLVAKVSRKVAVFHPSRAQHPGSQIRNHLLIADVTAYCRQFEAAAVVAVVAAEDQLQSAIVRPKETWSPWVIQTVAVNKGLTYLERLHSPGL